MSGKPAFKRISKLFKPKVPVGALGENHHIVLSRKSAFLEETEKHFVAKLLCQTLGLGSSWAAAMEGLSLSPGLPWGHLR